MKLAINGGPKVRKELFPSYKVIGQEEKEAVNRVLDSGILSKYLGCWHEDFHGGPEVRALESEWAKYFGVKHAFAVNSATSGLYCAVGASGVEPGEEIIVSPFTMSASATASLIFNAIPVFADIEQDFYCLDPKSVESKITNKTRAIIVVDIFGLPYDKNKLNELAKKYNLIVIEDCAQAPEASYGKQYAGTLGDIGVYSLNYHKHIHCGEGGLVVTNDDTLAERISLIRNHAESVVEAMGQKNLNNMIGFNFRMTELEASIARCQLKKLKSLVNERVKNINYLEKELSKIEFLEMPKVREECSHSYYVHAIMYNEQKAGIERDKFINAVRAELQPIELRESEGVKLGTGYCRPLYKLPMYQQLQAYGSRGYPFTEGNYDYKNESLETVEKVYSSLIVHELMRPGMSKDDLDDVIKAFNKVWENRNEIP